MYLVKPILFQLRVIILPMLTVTSTLTISFSKHTMFPIWSNCRLVRAWNSHLPSLGRRSTRTSSSRMVYASKGRATKTLKLNIWKHTKASCWILQHPKSQAIISYSLRVTITYYLLSFQSFLWKQEEAKRRLPSTIIFFCQQKVE